MFTTKSQTLDSHTGIVAVTKSMLRVVRSGALQRAALPRVLCRALSQISDPGRFQTPIVATLWEQRKQEKADATVAAAAASAATGETERTVKRPADSKVSVLMPFSTDEDLRMTYASPWG